MLSREKTSPRQKKRYVTKDAATLPSGESCVISKISAYKLVPKIDTPGEDSSASGRSAETPKHPTRVCR